VTGVSGVDTPETLTGKACRYDWHIPSTPRPSTGCFISWAIPKMAPRQRQPRIQTWSDDPSSTAYVADADGDLLGLVAVHICPFFERTGSWGRIVALIVSDQARGRGVGGQLVTAAESFATSRGCVRMEVTSGDRRQEAHEFYRRCGYIDQTGSSSRFLRDLKDTNRHEDQFLPRT
jgi:GNAT superfamily N-acetyltransferase